MAETKGNMVDNMMDEDLELQENQYLTFVIASEVYGINILSVVEIIRLVNITPVPETFNFIKGIINLRGKIIPIMDVRARFGLDEKEADDRTCIIVVSIKGMEMGLIVDRVSEVMEIPGKQIEIMPDIATAAHHKFVKGIGKIGDSVKIILDLDKLIFDEEIEKLKESL